MCSIISVIFRYDLLLLCRLVVMYTTYFALTWLLCFYCAVDWVFECFLRVAVICGFTLCMGGGWDLVVFRLLAGFCWL